MKLLASFCSTDTHECKELCNNLVLYVTKAGISPGRLIWGEERMESSCQTQLQKPRGIRKNIEIDENEAFGKTWNVTWTCVTWTCLRCWSRFEQKYQNKAIQYWWSDFMCHKFPIPSGFLVWTTASIEAFELFRKWVFQKLFKSIPELKGFAFASISN